MKVALVGAVALGGAICFFGVGGLFCAATLHAPRKLTAAPPNAATVELIAGDKAKLSAWWLRPGATNGNCVIVLHGIGDSRAASVGFADMFLTQGYSVLAPDSRAHGASGGTFVTYGLLEKYDTIGWAHWMQKQGCRKIYGLGESLGASVLIQAAAVEPAFAAVVAECPYADLRSTAEYRVQRMSRAPAVLAGMVVESGMLYARLVDGLDFREVSPVRSIARTATPILLIHGLADWRTPPSNSKQLASANPRDPLWLVPGAQHTGASSAEPEEFCRRVLGWFAEH